MSVMSLEKACSRVVQKIEELDPESISPGWIQKEASSSYQYFYKYLKCSLGYIDWDHVTRSLPYEYQKKWRRFKCQKRAPCNDSDVLSNLIHEYRDKLYVFVFVESKEERIWRERITVRLVRIAQAGHEEVYNYIFELLQNMVHDWVQEYRSLSVLNGYSDHIEKQIAGCIRRFRYAGSFTTYLYRTLQYSSLGLKPLEHFSLNEQFSDSTRTRAEFVVRNEETGDIELFRG